MIQKKICMLGSFAVGKTSLIRRFVESIYSEAYHTTVGVKIDKRVVRHNDSDVTLVLWDLYGEDEFQKMRWPYLRGAAGYLLVADGTRRNTLEKAFQYSDSAFAKKSVKSPSFWSSIKPISSRIGNSIPRWNHNLPPETGPSFAPAQKPAKMLTRLSCNSLGRCFPDHVLPSPAVSSPTWLRALRVSRRWPVRPFG
jgi:GTPase SAR1 family protein